MEDAVRGNNNEEVTIAVRSCLHNFTSNHLKFTNCKAAIDVLIHKWITTMERDGDYFEKYNCEPLTCSFILMYNLFLYRSVFLMLQTKPFLQCFCFRFQKNLTASTVFASLPHVLQKMFPLLAPQKVKCLQVCFRFQFLSSMCFRFHKNLTASASTSLAPTTAISKERQNKIFNT